MAFKVLKTSEAAAALGVSAKTLESWRCRKKGPPFVRVGSAKIGYLEKDLQQFVAESTRAHGDRNEL
jgi:predicted DNA-binding transcriptional regulator AlpA